MNWGKRTNRLLKQVDEGKPKAHIDTFVKGLTNPFIFSWFHDSEEQGIQQ